MTIEFDIWTWRDIQRICGTVAEKQSDPRYDLMTYLKFDCDDAGVTVTACTNYQITRMTCTAQYQTPPGQVTFFLPTVKAPSGTSAVNVTVGESPDTKDGCSCHSVSFINAKGWVIDTMSFTVPNGDYIDDDYFIKKTVDSISQYNNGIGQYCIGVDPKKLITALNGMKDSEYVVFNFDSPARGFMVRPTDELPGHEVMAIVLPSRLGEGQMTLDREG